ncbi:MAG: MarR family winged helix-turn-helix transcriptional regulator [Stackebrandtia sp.]
MTPDPGPGRQLFTFVRHWSRRSDPQAPEPGRLVLVTEAVHSLSQRGIAATVNAIAEEIGLDQSGASRLVKDAAAAGYLDLRPSVTDRRRRQATVAAAGLTLLEHAHDWQERVFDRLTEGWSDRQRRDFQAAMSSLVERSATLDTLGAALTVLSIMPIAAE